MSQIVPDVLGIVIAYVGPNDLVSFFIAHQLDFRMKFKYDAFRYRLIVDQANLMFTYFPNIVVVGLCIVILKDHEINHLKNMLGFDNLTHLKAKGYSTDAILMLN